MEYNLVDNPESYSRPRKFVNLSSFDNISEILERERK